MSDSAAVHFYLYRQGELVDKYGNAAFPFVKFKSEAEVLPFRGKVELWTDYLLEAKQAAIFSLLKKFYKIVTMTVCS